MCLINYGMMLPILRVLWNIFDKKMIDSLKKLIIEVLNIHTKIFQKTTKLIVKRNEVKDFAQIG